MVVQVKPSNTCYNLLGWSPVFRQINSLLLTYLLTYFKRLLRLKRLHRDNECWSGRKNWKIHATLIKLQWIILPTSKYHIVSYNFYAILLENVWVLAAKTIAFSRDCNLKRDNFPCFKSFGPLSSIRCNHLSDNKMEWVFNIQDIEEPIEDIEELHWLKLFRWEIFVSDQRGTNLHQTYILLWNTQQRSDSAVREARSTHLYRVWKKV